MIEYGFKKYSVKKQAGLMQIAKNTDVNKPGSYIITKKTFDDNNGQIIESEKIIFEKGHFTKARVDINEAISELQKELEQLAIMEADALALP